jgi:hypothetical protein
MKCISSLLIAMAMLSAAFGADWKIVSIHAMAFKPEEQTSKDGQDFWLNITLRNDSKVTQYIKGLPPNWFLVEAFIRRPQSEIWERQNIWYDRKLTWIPIKPGEEIKLRRRESLADAGLPMKLTFARALSAGDRNGSIILLDPFTIPSPSKNQHQLPKK